MSKNNNQKYCKLFQFVLLKFLTLNKKNLYLGKNTQLIYLESFQCSMEFLDQLSKIYKKFVMNQISMNIILMSVKKKSLKNSSQILYTKYLFKNFKFLLLNKILFLKFQYFYRYF